MEQSLVLLLLIFLPPSHFPCNFLRAWNSYLFCCCSCPVRGLDGAFARYCRARRVVDYPDLLALLPAPPTRMSAELCRSLLQCCTSTGDPQLQCPWPDEAASALAKDELTRTAQLGLLIFTTICQLLSLFKSLILENMKNTELFIFSAVSALGRSL